QALEAEKVARANEQQTREERDSKEEARQEAVINEGKARDAEADTKAYSDFLTYRILAVPRPNQVEGGLDPHATVVMALEGSERRLAEAFAGRPRAEATTRHALGVTWLPLNRFPQAEVHLQRAVALREQELGPNHLDTLNSRNSLAVLLMQMQKWPDAITLHE